MSSKERLGNTNCGDEFEIYETPSFSDSLEKYKHLKPAIENKIRFLKSNPFTGEPLKYELSGFRSIPVRRNFLILYGVCKECKKIGCSGFGDKAVVLYAFGPHDDLYKIARKLRK
ncbi:MAG: type II toxin-antitoxin system RelE/ParE family toxin [candidate division WOR-3 bacterium]|nr:type II toxin-antitoxin system RelE/ParE family toxin [candidate division WOR-3 bacterium]MDH5684232.1 type II toxin-antitoxin system RelE/ParE family toxin [candidate division WOR-3 bacterium]